MTRGSGGRDQSAHASIAQPEATPQQGRDVQRKQRVGGQRVAHTQVCGDRAAEVARPEHRAQDGGAWHEVNRQAQKLDDPERDLWHFSIGHVTPVIYALMAERGYFPLQDLLGFRQLQGHLQGHPSKHDTPGIEVSSGSLGQGLGAGVGTALNARRIRSDYRTYVLMGDGETAEGSVWESAAMAEFYKLDSLCAIVDVNALGQSRATQHGHDMEAHRRRWAGNGWHVVTIDGHKMEAILDALGEARATKGIPTVILAKTIKGKGVSFLEGAPNWHGKALKQEEVTKAVKELEAQITPEGDAIKIEIPRPSGTPKEERAGTVDPPSYKLNDQVATREAYGTALAKLGTADPRVVALDGDVKNSTFSERFEAAHPDRASLTR